MSAEDGGQADCQSRESVLQPNNPLHGITLEQIVMKLVGHYGWEELGVIINIKCFTKNPSIKSTLKFLRKTSWARNKVENLYLDTRFS